ncbi:uroporphyrinogen-III C-methyltransferase [Motiliproteus sediminis]|uniref:uroporphyrinogen-III C-methyltransferase n=1 Tax=Motiliproteus sediminis TaxID=1468178 RepID=UPI001AEF984E|nr:uroporphyrinogen-III C-methyltransferase [Motiliproteus sediminis]
MKHTDKPTEDTAGTIIEGEVVDRQEPDSDTSPPTLTEPAPDATPEADTAAAIDEQASEAGPAAEPEPSGAAGTPPPPPKDDATTAKPKGSKLAVVALLLALIALGGIGYGYTLVQKMHAQLQNQTAALGQSLDQSRAASAAAERRATGLEQQLGQTRQQLSAQQGSVNELQDRLTRAMQQINSIGTDSRRDWLLAEVEYLLRLANQRVLMESSASGALTLLQSADKILKETDDVSVYNVRKALASDIAALEAVPRLDVDGTFLRLAALNEQVNKLRLLPITDRHQIPSMLKEITPDSVSDSWQQGMAEAWAGAMDKLGNLIVIQHRDEPVKPLLSPEQHFFLQQNLHLMLEQAQLALLQGEQAAFDASLSKARDWVATYFQADDSTTKALLNGISQLQGTQVAPTLPDISGSLRTLKAYLAAQIDRKGAA